jgi:hypothetical protein
MTTEAIFEALRTKLTISPFVRVERRMKMLKDMNPDDFPAIYIVEPDQSTDVSKGSPDLLSLTAHLLVYFSGSDSQDEVKSSTLNPLLDSVRTALAPDPVTGFQTLGGLVSHCWITGPQPLAEDLLTPDGGAMLTVHILVGKSDLSTGNQYVFDAGTVWYVPETGDANVTLADTLTPIRVGNLKGVTLNCEFAIQETYGQHRLPLQASAALHRITGVAKIGTFSGQALCRILLGQNPSTGGTYALVDVAGTIPATSTYTVTPAMPTGGTWNADMGVIMAATGVALVRVAANPATGQYSVAAGVYTFNAAQKGLGVAISCLYTSTSGTTITWANPLRYFMPGFKFVLQAEYNGKKVCWVLNKVVSTRLSFPTVLEQFSISDFSFAAIADASNNIGIISAG